LLLASSIPYGATWRFDGKDWGIWNNVGNMAYGELRKFSHSYSPGLRTEFYAATTPTKDAGYILGGDNGGVFFQDIWRYEHDKGWALWDGYPLPVNPNPGTIKVPSGSNIFHRRYAHTIVVDKDENIWFYGGYTDSGKNNGNY
jgi:hypothetical protein